MRRLLGRLKRLGGNLITAAGEYLDARFGFFELLAALFGQSHAALEKFEGAFERQVARLEFADDFLQLLKRDFELRDGLFGGRLFGIGHPLHSNADPKAKCRAVEPCGAKAGHRGRKQIIKEPIVHGGTSISSCVWAREEYRILRAPRVCFKISSGVRARSKPAAENTAL